MGGSAIGAFGQMGAALITADKERAAAREQRRAGEKAAALEREYSEEAKMDIIYRMVPAMADYMDSIYQAADVIRTGEADTMQILQQSTGMASEILSSAGINAEQAIMGSAYRAQGIPRSTFNEQYQQIQALPPEQRAQAMSDMVAQSGGDPAAFTEYLQTPGIGFEGAQTALYEGLGEAGAALREGFGTAAGEVTAGEEAALGRTALGREALEEGRTAGLEAYQPYSLAGRAAVEQEAALSGAMGPEAQQAAIDAFIESPGQKYLREQQEKALLRSQAAIGGLGGGRIRTALQEQAMGIASTQQQQYLENLRNLATRGQAVAGAEAGIETGTAGALAGMYGTEAQISQQAATQRANLAQALGVSEAEIAKLGATELAALSERTGLNLSALQQWQGQQQAALQQSMGGQMAAATSGAAADIASLIERGGAGLLSSEQNISNLIASLTSGTGTNLANIALGQGSALAAGQLGAGEALAAGLKGVADIGAKAYEEKYGGTSQQANLNLNVAPQQNVQGFQGNYSLLSQ